MIFMARSIINNTGNSRTDRVIGCRRRSTNRIHIVVGIVTESEHITISTHSLANAIAHAHSQAPAAKKNLCGTNGASTKEYTFLRMDPHEILVDVCFEATPLTSVPCEVHEVTFLLRMFFD